MVDITPIVALLQSLGPWGWLVAGALVLLQMRLNGGPLKKPAPVVPSDPNAPTPAPTDPIDSLLDRIRERWRQRFPNIQPFFEDATGGPSYQTAAIPAPVGSGPVVSLAQKHAEASAKIEAELMAILGK